MPTREMCAECARVCDCDAIVFKQHPPSQEFSESRDVSLGNFCEPAAWKQIFHALRTRADYIGGEVRRVLAA